MRRLEVSRGDYRSYDSLMRARLVMCTDILSYGYAGCPTRLTEKTLGACPSSLISTSQSSSDDMSKRPQRSLPVPAITPPPPRRSYKYRFIDRPLSLFNESIPGNFV